MTGICCRPLLYCAAFFCSLEFCQLSSLAIEIEVELSSGEVIRGVWRDVDDSSIKVGRQGQAIDLSQVVMIRPATSPEPQVGPPLTVLLNDGSSIRVEGVAGDDKSAKLETRNQPLIELPLTSLRAIRYRASNPATDADWLGLLEEELRSDKLVIRRSNSQLDPVEGIVLSIQEKTISFDLEGDKIDAPIERLEGVLFRTTVERVVPSKTRVEDIFGSVFVAARLELMDSDTVNIVLTDGSGHRIPLSQMRRITMASGRQMLAEATPAAVKMQPYLKSSFTENLFADWFGPSASGDDIIAVAGGEIEYRVSDGFEYLVGSVGRSKQAEGAATILVQVWVDEKVQWQQELDDRSPAGFKIPVSTARRVKLVVRPTEDGDVGDQVRFYKPRLLK